MDESFGLTPELISLVKTHEGWVSHPYLCPAGYPTIGYGHRIPSMRHPSIDMQEGDHLLMSDLHTARDHALRLSPILMVSGERRCAAIVDFIFNLGWGAYRDSTLRKRVDVANWPLAAIEMQRWVHAHEPVTGKVIVLAGLLDRRRITARWLLEG